jgi:hypothetical protein
MDSTPKRTYGRRPLREDRLRLTVDVPIQIADELKKIAEGIGITTSEFLRMELGRLINTYSGKSNNDWTTNDSNPSREVIEKMASLYEGRYPEFQILAWRQFRRDMVLALEVEKILKPEINE